MLCLLQYFSQLMQAEKNGDDLSQVKLSFERLVLRQTPDWSNCNKQLGVLLSCEGLIEDNHAALQVDFANKFIGGGVLQFGNVQVSYLQHLSSIVASISCVGRDSVCDQSRVSSLTVVI